MGDNNTYLGHGEADPCARSSISFESSLPSESPLLAILRNSDLRNPSLSSLRPTHTSLPISPIAFPNYTLSDNNTLLPFPPFLKSGTPASAADGTDKEQEKAPTGKLGRIYPFASLFASSTPSASSSPKTPAPPVPSSPQSTAQASLAPERPLSPPLSSRDESSPYHQSLAVASAGETSSIHSDATAEGFHVTAYTVSGPIRYAEVHKALSKAVRAFIRDELSRLPDKIVDRVLVLALSGICPALAGSVGQDLSKANQSSDRDRSVGLDFRDPMLTGEKLQDFVEGVYDELMFHHRADSSHIFAEGSGSRRKASGTIPWSKGTGGETETEAEKRDRKERTRRAKEEVAEKEATEGAERVEGVLCRLLYNR